MKAYVGHGRHLDFLRAAGHSDGAIMAMLYQAHLTSQANVLFEADDVRLVCEPNVELGFGLLLQGGQIASAFPYTLGGHDWPVEVREVYEWPNPVEGQLLGACHGARIGWFDPHYAVNRGRYRVGAGPQTVRMNALAYRVWRTQFADAAQEQQMGQMKAYMPLPGDEASDDEVQFISHVEAVRSVAFHGVPLDVYTLTLALPGEFSMRVDVFTARAVADEVFAVGERISGACWLFGRLVEGASGG